MLPPVILNLTMSYFNPTEKTNSNIPVELALPTGIPMQIASVSPLTTEDPEQPMLTQVNAINSIPAISLPEETWMLGGLQDFTTQPTESKERSTLFPLSGFRLKVVETQLFFKNVRFPTADQQATAAVPRNDSAKANNLTCLPDKFYFSLGS